MPLYTSFTHLAWWLKSWGKNNQVKASYWKWAEQERLGVGRFQEWEISSLKCLLSKEWIIRGEHQKQAPGLSKVLNQRLVLHAPNLPPESYISRCNCCSIWLLHNVLSSWEKGTKSCPGWRCPSVLFSLPCTSWVEGNEKLAELTKGKLSLAWTNSDFLAAFPSYGSWGWPKHFP